MAIVVVGATVSRPCPESGTGAGPLHLSILQGKKKLTAFKIFLVYSGLNANRRKRLVASQTL